MSSSKGIVLLPGELLKIMPPGALKRMVLGRDPGRALDLDLTQGFPRFMDEYRAAIGELLVPFTHLVTISQTTRGDTDAAVEMLLQGGYREAVSDREKLAENLAYAHNWAENWAPEPLRLGILELWEAVEAAKGLDEAQLQYLNEVASLLESSMDGDTVQNILYTKAAEHGLKPKQAFAAVYTVLLGRESGPKAGPFIVSIGVWLAQQRFLGVMQDTMPGGVEG
jgi:lysyl-tRNA synthetase class 1